MRTIFLSFILLLAGAVSASAQCGALVLNPTTNLLDCTGPAGSSSGTVTSVSGSGPSWLTWTIGTATTTPAISLAPTTGQTSHQVIGTCGSATTFAPCALVAGDIPTLNQSTSGNAATATALAANGTNCSAGSPPLGVDASGNAENCAAITDAQLSTSDITTNNVSTSKHGFVPKAPNDATKYLDGTGAYSTPAGATVLSPYAALTAPAAIGGWTAFNSASGTQDANGFIKLTQTGSGANNIIGYTLAVPATPYTRTAAFTFTGQFGNFLSYGMVLRNSGSGSLISLGPGANNGNYILNQKYTNATTFSAAYTQLSNAYIGQTVWMRVADDGSTRTFSWSNDGLNFSIVGTSGHTDFITADQIGFYLDVYTSSVKGTLNLVSWN